MPFPINADAIVTPERIEATLLPETCITEIIQVTTGATPPPQLDVIFVIDATSSMNTVIGEVTSEVDNITNNIRRLIPDTSFALGTFADYPITSNSRDYPWRLDQDFTTDVVMLQQALQNIALTHGGDGPESYLRALYETQFLNWRAGSRRIVILFGDAPSHDPDPGRDGRLGTADDLTRNDVITQLADTTISVLAIYSNPSHQEFYDAVANGTGGRALNLGNTTELPRIVQELVAGVVTDIGALTLAVQPAIAPWMEWTPSRYTDVSNETQYDFALTICVPPGTTIGEYTLNVDVTADGASPGRVPVLIHVNAPPTSTPTATPTNTPTNTPTPTPWCPLPTIGGPESRLNWCILLIPLGLFLLSLLIFLGVSRKPAPPSRTLPPQVRSPEKENVLEKSQPTPSQRGASIHHGNPLMHEEPKKE